MWIIQSPEIHLHFEGKAPPELFNSLTNNNNSNAPEDNSMKKLAIPEGGAKILTQFSKDKSTIETKIIPATEAKYIKKYEEFKKQINTEMKEMK